MFYWSFHKRKNGFSLYFQFFILAKAKLYNDKYYIFSYSIGAEVPVEVLVTANHLGFFKFKLCNLDKFRTESEECFDDISLKLSDGQDRFVINENVGPFYMKLKLPEDLVCEHCVLQWTWTTGEIIQLYLSINYFL